MATLDARIERAKIKGVPNAMADRAKRILRSYLQTAQSYGMPVENVIAEMGNGEASRRLGAVAHMILHRGTARVGE